MNENLISKEIQFDITQMKYYAFSIDKFWVVDDLCSRFV